MRYPGLWKHHQPRATRNTRQQFYSKANLAEIGIQVNVKAIDSAVFFSGDPDASLSARRCEEATTSATQWNGTNDGDSCNAGRSQRG